MAKSPKKRGKGRPKIAESSVVIYLRDTEQVIQAIDADAKACSRQRADHIRYILRQYLLSVGVTIS